MEDTARGLLVQIMNQIIEEEKLPFEGVDQQWPIPFNGTQKYADLVIWKQIQSRAACIIEYKPPFWSALDMLLIGDAESKAFKISPQAPYFATWNTNELVLFETFDEAARSVVERRRGQYRVASVGSLKELWRPEIQNGVRDRLREFLQELAKIVDGVAELPSLRPDDFFIHAIRSAVEAMYFPISDETKKRHKRVKSFATKLNRWFVEQGWSAPVRDIDFEKAARQFAYLLGDKVLFYHALRRANFPLPDLLIPETVTDGEKLKHTLQSYFEKATEVTKDYEPVFSVNFVDRLPIPKSIVPSIISFVNSFRSYDISKLEYGDIGKIFDSLIPEHERHLLGQYFTPDHVVDLTNAFCIRKATDTVADFGCGVGTFLVRAYGLKRFLKDRRPHSDLIGELYGVDISKFPAHLATINLVIRDLASKENYPRIFNKDFFDISPRGRIKWGWEPVGEKITTLDLTEREVELPVLDAVVGNPPYTRQEEIEKILGEGYKKKLDKKIREDWKEKVSMGKRAGIHGYFFLHGMSFLKEGGHFGYVVSNSWLDVDYGKFFQEFFLKHSKIKAIIEPKLERWFAEADVNTCIVVLEKCSGPVGERKKDKKKREKKNKDREENLVRFVQLKKPLSELLGPDDGQRFKRASRLVKRIMDIENLHEDDSMRVYPKQQKHLWEEGYDSDKKEYVGSKWGKYLRAPDIFFKILAKGKDLLVPLKRVATVSRGFTTGANKFFYLTEEEIEAWNLEKRFWMHREDDKWVTNHVVRLSRECLHPIIQEKELSSLIILTDEEKSKLKKTRMAKYIKWGETQDYHKRPTCRSRSPWYSISGQEKADILWPKAFNDRVVAPLISRRFYGGDRFYNVRCNNRKLAPVLAAVLNSTLQHLIVEIWGRVNLGQGALDNMTYEAASMPVVDPSALPKDIQSELRARLKEYDKVANDYDFTLFEESTLKAENASDVVTPKRVLDEIMNVSILGLNDPEEVDLYKGVVDLVSSRFSRAESFKRKGGKAKLSLRSLADGILRDIDLRIAKQFPEDYLPDNVKTDSRDIPSGGLWELKSDLRGIFLEKAGERIDCATKDEARYLRYAALYGPREISIPAKKSVLRKMIEDYRLVYAKLKGRMDELIGLYGVVPRQREDLERMVWDQFSQNVMKK